LSARLRKLLVDRFLPALQNPPQTGTFRPAVILAQAGIQRRVARVIHSDVASRSERKDGIRMDPGLHWNDDFVP
jgi:hypothetical protein